MEYISWNKEKEFSFLKGFHVKIEKLQRRGERGKEEEPESKGWRRAWSLEISGLTQVRGVYRRLMGIMG